MEAVEAYIEKRVAPKRDFAILFCGPRSLHKTLADEIRPDDSVLKAETIEEAMSAIATNRNITHAVVYFKGRIDEARDFGHKLTREDHKLRTILCTERYDGEIGKNRCLTYYLIDFYAEEFGMDEICGDLTSQETNLALCRVILGRNTKLH